MRLGFDDDISQQVLLASGSFTGYHPYTFGFGSGYLSATDHFKQPLCGNEEGWGPWSPSRYDFTPCFIDVWVASVAVFGIVAGSLAILWLIQRRNPTQVTKDWHFWTKQVGFLDHTTPGDMTDNKTRLGSSRLHRRRVRCTARHSDHQLP
jgi:hypothetical protein